MFLSGQEDPVARIEAALAELAGEELAGLAAVVLSERVLGLARLVERTQAELVRAVGQWDAESAWADDGALSAASWLANRAPMGRVAASRLVRRALAEGVVSSTQVETIGSVTRGCEALYPEGEAALLGAAEVLAPDDFGVVARRWRSLADDQLASEAAVEVFERRCLHVSKTLFNTVRIDGELDAEGGATVLAALDALDGPDPVDGPVAARPYRGSAACRRAGAAGLGVAGRFAGRGAAPGGGEGGAGCGHARRLPAGGSHTGAMRAGAGRTGRSGHGVAGGV